MSNAKETKQNVIDIVNNAIDIARAECLSHDYCSICPFYDSHRTACEFGCSPMNWHHVGDEKEFGKD